MIPPRTRVDWLRAFANDPACVAAFCAFACAVVIGLAWWLI